MASGRAIDTLRIGIAGAGRMGQGIAASVEASDKLVLAGIWRRGEDLDPVVASADVVIDFSLPEATSDVLAASIKHGKPIVCGVSGLTDKQLASLREAASQIAIVYDRNMSLGVAVLERIVADAARALGKEFAIDISETHHVHKKDAPSGTALKLGEAIAAARGDSDTHAISFASQRVGEVPGDHEVTMRSATESLTFAHSVTTRQVFVDGALRAAQWLVDQKPGYFTMRDVLFHD